MFGYSHFRRISIDISDSKKIEEFDELHYFISDLDDQINYQLSMGKTSFAFECVFLLKNLYFAESCW